MRPWLEARIALPFAPFIIDFVVRFLVLGQSLRWFYIPDIKTFTISIGIFCFLIASDMDRAPSIPSDSEYEQKILALRRRFNMFGIITTIFFGVAATVDAIERKSATEEFSQSLYPAIFVVVATVFVIAVIEAIVANLRYKLKYG
ncbi:MAG TPA: hypothetical protein VF645_03420 [Allosphingosinicella sp.]|jgi:Trk-type K+ transport system membrane component